MALNLSKLTAYVQEQRVPLIHEVTLKAKTANMLSWQSDIKTSAKLNLLNTNVSFGDGLTCGFDDKSTQEVSQRTLETGVIKVEMKWCAREMAKYWMQHEIRINANEDVLPFEEDFVNGIVADVNAKVEKAIWQGDKSSVDVNLNKFNGFLKILSGETTPTATVDPAKVYDSVMAVYSAIPQKAFDRGDVVVFIGEDLYRKYIMELVAKNLYHYAPEEKNYIPGTTTEIVPVGGLNGTNKMVAGSLRNMFYGFDEQGADNDFKFWYSADNDDYRLRIVFNAGVQVAYPDEIVVGATA